MTNFLAIILVILLGAAISFPKWITLIYPLPNKEIVFAMAQEYDVDPYLVFAIIRAESKYQTTAQSPAGARGLMQIMPNTARMTCTNPRLTSGSAAGI
jgi:soluble lytic murein transglycosylase